MRLASAAFARPAVLSLVAQPMLTSLACHSPSALPHATFGAVVSRWIVTDWLLVPPALVAEQISVVPAVSVLMVVGSQSIRAVMVDGLSTTLQLTETSPTYQPSLPGVPVTSSVISGGVVSKGEDTSATVCPPPAAMAVTPLSPAGTVVWP